jgi:hypothetical protein
MILKAGTAYPENSDPIDCDFQYEDGMRVIIGYTLDGVEITLASIDPDDFLAIADAIRGNIIFTNQLKNDKKR